MGRLLFYNKIVELSNSFLWIKLPKCQISKVDIPIFSRISLKRRRRKSKSIRIRSKYFSFEDVFLQIRENCKHRKYSSYWNKSSCLRGRQPFSSTIS